MYTLIWSIQKHKRLPKCRSHVQPTIRRVGNQLCKAWVSNLNDVASSTETRCWWLDVAIVLGVVDMNFAGRERRARRQPCSLGRVRAGSRCSWRPGGVCRPNPTRSYPADLAPGTDPTAEASAPTDRTVLTTLQNACSWTVITVVNHLTIDYWQFCPNPVLFLWISESSDYKTTDTIVSCKMFDYFDRHTKIFPSDLDNTCDVARLWLGSGSNVHPMLRRYPSVGERISFLLTRLRCNSPITETKQWLSTVSTVDICRVDYLQHTFST